MSLPVEDYSFYCGIDPGFKGAFGLMNAAGTTARAWPMPVIEGEKDRDREIDLAGLGVIVQGLTRYPRLVVGLEWPTTRPGEAAESSERFGRQKGYLEAFLYLKRIPYFKIAPNLWKGRLGLDGKDWVGANDRAANLFRTYYPDRGNLISGVRGGILDGPLDALLIAHFLRTRGATGMKSIVAKFGKDSVESLAFILGGGRRKRKFGKRTTDL